MYKFEYDHETFHRKRRTFKTKLFDADTISVIKSAIGKLAFPIYGGDSQRFRFKAMVYLNGMNQIDCLDEFFEVFRAFERDTIAIDSVDISDDNEVTIVYRAIDPTIEDIDCLDEFFEVFRAFERDTIAIDSVDISDDNEVTIVYRVIDPTIEDKDYNLIPRILNLTDLDDKNIDGGRAFATFDVMK